MDLRSRILTFANQKILVFSKTIFLNLLDRNQTVFLTVFLREHKLKYNFQNCLNPLCSCGSSIESTPHFLLRCPIFHDKRHTILRTLNNLDCKILESNNSCLTQTLLFDCTSFDSETNTLVLKRYHWLYFIHWKIQRTSFTKTLFFVYNFLILSELPVVYFVYLFFHFNLLFSIFFF